MLNAWDLMGGRIDWAALPVVCELYGIRDPDTFIAQLVAIREHVRKL